MYERLKAEADWQPDKSAGIADQPLSAHFPRRWITMLSGLVMQFTACTMYAVPLYTTQMRGQFGLSQTEMSLILSVGDFGMFFGVLNGLAYDAWGPAIACGLCLLQLSGGYVLVWATVREWVPASFWVVLILYFLVGQGSSMANCIAVTVNVKNWNPALRGRIVGIQKATWGAGLIVYSLLYRQWFGDGTSSNMAMFFLFLTVLTAATCIIGAFTMRVDASAQPRPKLDPRKEASVGQLDLTGLSLFRNLRFWSLWGTYCIVQGSALLVVNMLGSMLLSVAGQCGTTEPAVATAQYLSVIVVGVANGVGRIAGGFLKDLVSDAWAFVALLFLIVANNAFLVFAYSVTEIMVGAAVSAFLFGANNTLVTCLVSQFGMTAYGTNLGYMTTAPGIGIIAFSYASGRFYDQQVNCGAVCYGTHCFRTGYIVAAAVGLAAACISIYFPVSKRTRHWPIEQSREMSQSFLRNNSDPEIQA